ncbi:uncharacterized protein PAC_14408 [Phialocephala subalpina]|uniref:Calcium channel YVC1-like C-terminal transmembrane domain-containing protein n=1 Tax=Phialocephala subalpina TaxID=576137 RepID=A0A1L7XHJ5_9HELO|nr:uncharacterized protein PAC_14408 [Phialocephala subalpina]
MTPPGSPIVDAQVRKLPEIGPKDPFVKVVKVLSNYMVDEIALPSTFEQLRTTSAGNKIRILVDHLVINVTNPCLINALLTLKWHFSTLAEDDRGVNETRANACEIVSWRFLARISERDAMDFCLFELPSLGVVEACTNVDVTERSSLLPQFRPSTLPTTRPGSKRVEMLRSISNIGIPTQEEGQEEDEGDPTSAFTGLNGLEIAAVADCKKFLSQKVVQKIIHGIWRGDITFWQDLNANTKKKPAFYNKRHSDYFTRLRVPLYQKTFEVLFFATFLFLYYAVLVERNPYYITPLEITLYVWFAAFAYDELSEFIDAGSIFYAVDIWNGADLIIIIIGVAFLITRAIGLIKDDRQIIDDAFDILSLEALFMVPRICSLLSLHPYFGTLIPCLKEMAKDFVKFMVVVAVLYVGFLTTFTLLARDTFKLSDMSWILIKVFFGSSYLGFDIMYEINPVLGPPLMLVFVTMTNILLITSLISILSDSFSKVIAHAREEYLFVYSVYVLEASTSNRLTHFYPPFNLIPLVFIRPLRLFIPADQLRTARIFLLKATHLPIIGAIWLFETAHDKVRGQTPVFSMGPGSEQLIRESTIPTKKPRPFLSNRASANTASQHFPDPRSHQTPAECCADPFDEAPRSRKESRKGEPSVVLDSPELDGLKTQVEDLSLKIAELTALIMAQQGTNNEE